MKLLNFTTNSRRDGHDLSSSIDIYTFEDIQVKINELLQVTVDGIITLEFDSEKADDDQSYFISSCDINILNIWDEDNEKISLSKEFIDALKHEIQNALESESIENDLI